MEENIIDTVTVGASVAATDFSIFGLFMEADLVVKAVIVVLLLASFWSWAIIFDKVMHMRRLNTKTAEFEDSFWSGGSLDDLYERIGNHPPHPMASLFAAAMREWRRSTSQRKQSKKDLHESLQQRIERVMQVSLGREMDYLERHMVFLASVGATAPFIGLFGTVWGIMNSFEAIGLTKNTSLAVVAPGIAEALFATALGLVAAIPAVIAYNKISNDLGRYANRLESFAGEFSAVLSRQLEENS
jgi:biopolymer transport protein TolQ